MYNNHLCKISNVISRKFFINNLNRNFEYAADQYAVNNSLEMGNALTKIHAMNVLNIMPDKYYSVYHYSHPSLTERLDKLENYRKKYE